MILTLAVVFPDIGETAIAGILFGGGILAVVVTIGVRLAEPVPPPAEGSQHGLVPTQRWQGDRNTWRMPPLGELPPARLTTLNRIWLIVLRFYLMVAAGLVLVRIVQLAMSGV
jgi:hypothetical protein